MNDCRKKNINYTGELSTENKNNKCVGNRNIDMESSKFKYGINYHKTKMAKIQPRGE